LKYASAHDPGRFSPVLIEVTHRYQPPAVCPGQVHGVDHHVPLRPSQIPNLGGADALRWSPPDHDASMPIAAQKNVNSRFYTLDGNLCDHGSFVPVCSMVRQVQFRYKVRVV